MNNKTNRDNNNHHRIRNHNHIHNDKSNNDDNTNAIDNNKNNNNKHLQLLNKRLFEMKRKIRINIWMQWKTFIIIQDSTAS